MDRPSVMLLMKLTIASSRLGCDLFLGASAVLSSMTSAEAYLQSDRPFESPHTGVGTLQATPIAKMRRVSRRQCKHSTRKLQGVYEKLLSR